MDFLGLQDILLIFLLMLAVPLLVNYYLTGANFTGSFRRGVILGGILWVFYSVFGEGYLYQMMGLSPMDAYVHWSQACSAATELAKGNWPFSRTIPLANEAYGAYLAILIYITGLSYHVAVAINGFFAFWGGLVLAKSLSAMFVRTKVKSSLLLLVIFFPSSIFWTTSNLKEAFMYWSACQIFALTFSRAVGLQAIVTPGAVAAVIVGGLFRPHVCLVWLGSCAGVMLFRRGQKIYALLMLMTLPVMMAGLQAVVGADVSTPVAAIEHWSQKGAVLASPEAASNIEFGEGGPVFFVSGFTSIFFRPFPWQIRSLRILIAALETWALTMVLAIGWWRMSPMERSVAIRLPPVQAAALVCILFSVFFTYMPNEGMMVRQRVQMVPALMILAFVPYLLRNYMQQRFSAQRYSGRVSYSMPGTATR